MVLENIKFLKDAKNINIISEGYSGAYKCSFEKNSNKYFLKIGKFKINENLEDMLNKTEIPHPKVIELGKYDNEYNYIIEEYIDGNNLKYQLDKYDSKFIYEYGFKIGQQYRNLRKIYPDKAITEEKYKEYLLMVQERISKLKKLIKIKKCNLTDDIIEFLNDTIQYLEKNINIIKGSSLVFGHTDIKPSNYLIIDKDIIATDIEHTDYKELSLSMLWSFARSDLKDEKNLAFAKGYINALFNFNIPKNILDCFDYTYLFNVAGVSIKYIENKEYDKLSTLIKYINRKYETNNELKISDSLKSVIDFSKIEILKGCDVTIIDGSYSPNNLTFKCQTNENTYFLKVMKMTDERHKDTMKFYEILNQYNIPSVPMIETGYLLKDKCYYTISEFKELKEMDESIGNTFLDGFKSGQLVARYLIKLKNEKVKPDKIYDKDNLYQNIMNDIEFIYSNNNYYKYMPWDKEKLVNYINKYIKSFDMKSINLIHGDIKFGNILYGNNDIYFVDNESFKYSYDIVNFMYNIQAGFLDEDNKCYKGFVNGYLKFMYNGKIPFRIQNQVKLLLIYYVVRSVRKILEKRNDASKIKTVLNGCRKYIDDDNDIKWLM